MITHLRRLFRLRPHLDESTKQAESIIDTSRELRVSMLRETKASRNAQREMRRNPVEQVYLGGKRHAE